MFQEGSRFRQPVRGLRQVRSPLPAAYRDNKGTEEGRQDFKAVIYEAGDLRGKKGRGPGQGSKTKDLNAYFTVRFLFCKKMADLVFGRSEVLVSLAKCLYL